MDSDIKAAGRGTLWISVAALLLIVLAGYGNTLRAPFVFDDRPSIADNVTLRNFGTAFLPPTGGLPVSGRPIVNATLAVNYALGGLDPRGYHLANLLGHATAALLLFGLVRRTVRLTGAVDGTGFAFAAAALWAAHPLLTESVTYTVQRAEVLVGIFYLLTLYAFARSRSPGGGNGWLVVSAASCLLGMATKEVMASAPLVVCAYDRTFASGTLRAAWRQRRLYYFSLAATWGVLAALVLSTGARGGTAGFGLNISPFAYALTQCEAIVRYLGLALFPNALSFDYNTYLATSPAVFGYVIVILLALGMTALAWKRWPIAGFLGAAFWAILAPSSSIVPVATQTIAEHRMYLPLAVVIVAATIGGAAVLPRRMALAAAVGGLALLALTVARNRTYRTELSLWADTAAKRPENVRARYNLATAALEAGDPARALAESQAALRLGPDSADAHYNHSLILLRTNRPAEALEESRAALRYRPSMADAAATAGVALLRLDRIDEAIACFRSALRLNPRSFEAHDNLGSALMQIGKPAEALPEVEAAIVLRPESANAHNNLAEIYRQSGRADDAIAQCQRALALAPDFAEAHYTMGNILLQERRPREAVDAFTLALRQKPEWESANVALAGALLQSGQTEEALGRYEAAVQSPAASFEAHYNYANALFRLNRFAAAASQYEAALRKDPDAYVAHYNLGHALRSQDKDADAIVSFRNAVRLKPESVDANFALGETFMAVNQPAQALPVFETVVRLAPNSAEANAGAGDAAAELGHVADAMKYYQAALRLDPSLKDVKERLAQLRDPRHGPQLK